MVKKTAFFLSLCLLFVSATPALAGEITVGGNMTYNMYLPSGDYVAIYPNLEPWFYSTYTLDITGRASETASALVEFRYANNLPENQVLPKMEILSKYYLKWSPPGADFYFGKNFFPGNRFKILDSGITSLWHEGVAIQTTGLGSFTGTLLFDPNYRGLWVDSLVPPFYDWQDLNETRDFTAAAQADFRVPFGELGLNFMFGGLTITGDKFYEFSAEAAIPIPVTPVTMVMEVWSSTVENASVRPMLGLHTDIRGTMLYLEGSTYQEGDVVEYAAGLSRNFDGLEATLEYQGLHYDVNGFQGDNSLLTGELKVEF